MTEPPMTHRVWVDLGERGYPVEIGPGVRRLLPDVVGRIGAARVAVVSARPDLDAVPDPGVPALRITARDGEHGKTLANVQELCEGFASFGLTRSDAVVSCGGGTTTDVVGLAAALYHRGIAVIHLPTSLLAQVDASVGGKTAVNLPAGKNLVGAYWQPSAVLCDTDHLRTLPAREWTNGYGEIARAHFIGAGDLRGLPVAEQIARSVALKASIVARDERDGGLRHILNYGHTLGHALEIVTGFEMRHGEGVAVGTVFAGRLAAALGLIDEARAAEHLDVVAHYGLPTALPADVDIADLVAAMRRDKKSTNTGLTFVLDSPEGPQLVPDVPPDVVVSTLEAMDRDGDRDRHGVRDRDRDGESERCTA
ncbi:5-deoxy-5-amino-3-dehydroquinate synthase [Parafrankia irregularis]|uniref:5-deoxy-5-amino-3-dehydroquinate synthase n=1 Tax=Parafrankia irregularis TaxID=795642 RepID=A0A0S4QQL5_9ACTN|nr:MULTISPECIES: 3-dehydroquinate synthase family protein [Parafrankia]MBE3206233.1 3-dehydroquinate synthase [Parafrankia sp. CH37]CUU57545.1 5-deoxy-5-amino-3-dehydroquinate synthase [Parafrankia irregularis]